MWHRHIGFGKVTWRAWSAQSWDGTGEVETRSEISGPCEKSCPWQPSLSQQDVSCLVSIHVSMLPPVSSSCP